jgi:hypothetical protein
MINASSTADATIEQENSLEVTKNITRRKMKAKMNKIY